MGWRFKEIHGIIKKVTYSSVFVIYFTVIPKKAEEGKLVLRFILSNYLCCAFRKAVSTGTLPS